MSQRGGPPVGVVPEEDALVAFVDWPRAQLLRDVGTVLVRDVLVLAVGAPAPAVVGALDAVAVHLPVVAEVRPEMEAVSVEDVQLPVEGAVGDELPSEILERLHRLGRDLGAPADHEPPSGAPRERHAHLDLLAVA